MPYSNYDYRSYNEFFKKRDCRNQDRWGSYSDYDRSTYSSNYGRYYGPWEWFSEAANAVLEYFLEPTDRHDHQALYKELTTGDGIEGILDHGQKQPGLIKFYVLLCIIGLVGVLMFLGGVGWQLFGKKQKDPNNDKKRRAKLVPLFIFHIPVFIVVTLILAIFSMNLWSLYSTQLYSEDISDSAVRGANTDLQNMIKRGNCEYDASVVEGARVINKQIDDFFTKQLEGCQANASIAAYIDTLNKDKDMLFNLKESTVSIVKQMEELQEVIKNEKQQNGFTKMSKVLTKLSTELDSVYKALDKEAENAKKVEEERRADIEVLHRKLIDSSEPLTLSLEEIQKRLKTVIDTFHSTVTDETKWINVLGERMGKLKAQVKREGDPLPGFILLQLVIAIPVLLSLLALAVAFLAIAVRIVYPKAFSKFPGANKKTRRFLTASFFTQCIFVGFIAFTTWVSLNYAASLNVSCKPMYSTGYFVDPMSNFYKDVLGSFYFKDFEGNEINQTFADTVALSRSNNPITNIKNAKNGKLIPKFSELVDFDRWFNDIQKTVKENPAKDIQIADRNKIAKQLPYIIAEFHDQNSLLLVKNSQSQLAKLVAKELDDLERKLNSLTLTSLNSVAITGCNGRSVDAAIIQNLKSIFDISIDKYERNFNNRLYSGDFIYHSYMGVGTDLCVQWRYPLSGMWLSGTLLCVALLVSALVLFKVSKNLYPVGDEDIHVMSDTTSVSTIYAPLIDGDKNPTVQQI